MRVKRKTGDRGRPVSTVMGNERKWDEFCSAAHLASSSSFSLFSSMHFLSFLFFFPKQWSVPVLNPIINPSFPPCFDFWTIHSSPLILSLLTSLSFSFSHLSELHFQFVAKAKPAAEWRTINTQYLGLRCSTYLMVLHLSPPCNNEVGLIPYQLVFSWQLHSGLKMATPGALAASSQSSSIWSVYSPYHQTHSGILNCNKDSLLPDSV